MAADPQPESRPLARSIVPDAEPIGPAAEPLRTAAEQLGDLRQALPVAAGPLRARERIVALCADIRLQKSLDDSLQAAPLQAGPLNSQGVVVRTLQRLHHLSPAYVRALVVQVEALAAVERLSSLDP